MPITVLCGFLGARRTTLLNLLLANQSGQKGAIIGNGAGAIDVDACPVVGTKQAVLS